MGSWFGLDLGEKRVGVALADETLRLATPLVTLQIRGRNHLLEQLNLLIEEHRVAKIVVGLPKTMKGEIGIAAEKIINEVDWLKTKIDRPWIFWDERLTTQEIERVLRDAGVGHEKRKLVRDQLSAQRILQSYLDSHSEKDA